MFQTMWCSVCQGAPADGELLLEDADGMQVPIHACQKCVDTKIKPDGTIDIEFDDIIDPPGNALG